MFEVLQLGNNPSSQARAGFAALSAHAAVIAVALYGTEQPTPLPRAVADTVHIELARIPTREQAAPARKLFQTGSLPSAPVVPATSIVLPSPRLALDSTHRDPGLAALRSSTISEALASSGESQHLASAASGEVDQLPTLKGNLSPRYPAELRATLLTGQVVVEYVVNAEGRAGSVRVVRSGHPAFSQAVIQALANARFNPARIGRKPISVLVQQTIRFEAVLH